MILHFLVLTLMEEDVTSEAATAMAMICTTHAKTFAPLCVSPRDKYKDHSVSEEEVNSITALIDQHIATVAYTSDLGAVEDIPGNMLGLPLLFSFLRHQLRYRHIFRFCICIKGY